MNLENSKVQVACRTSDARRLREAGVSILDLYKGVTYITVFYPWSGPAYGPKKVRAVNVFPPMKNGPTKGESKTAIRNAIIKFGQDFMGRGPTEVKAFILRDLVLVRLKDVLTPAERQLAKNS